MIGRTKRVLLIAVALILGWWNSGVGNVFAALPQETLYFHAISNILLYDPTGGCGTSSITPVLGKNVTWIGDSYSEGAESESGGKLISGKLSGVDIGEFNYNGGQTAASYVKGGKGVGYDLNDNPGGISILKKIVEKGELRPYLVFALGGNGGLSAAEIEEVLQIAGSKTKVVFVNLYMTTSNAGIQAYIKSSNEAMAEVASKHNNVKVADWAAVAKDEYYSGDSSGVHPFGGYEQWVEVIYEALGSFTGKTSSNGGIANNQNYAGDTVWSEEQLSAIKANRAVYEKAEQQSGVPWQAIATMHSLESGLARFNPAGGQGLYGLYMYTNGGTNANAFVPEGPITDAEFERQTLIAASEMKKIIESAGLEVDSDEGIKALLFQYNGKAQQYIDKALAMGFSREEAEIGEGSPYVMNRYDARRDPNSNEMDPAWPGRFVADGVYNASATAYDFGGFVKYLALVGATGGRSGICIGLFAGGNMDLNATAIALAWAQKDRENTFTKGKPEYLAAILASWISGYEASVAKSGSFNRGDGTLIPVGMSCDNFVGTVVRYSGIDPDFPVWLGAQKSYLESSGKWEVVDGSDSSKVKAGDIRIENGGGHIIMIAEVDGELKVASASSGERFGDIQNYYTKPGTTYRLKM